MKSPYYFIPLNKEVFYPNWADRVSHDIPFSDGECGEIEIEIKAEKPIFIRNHYEEKEEHEKGKDYYETEKDGKVVRISTEFCHRVNKEGAKEYFIPSTSFRNMLKKYMRVLSFGEIQVDTKRHSSYLTGRDRNNSKFTYSHTVLEAIEQIVDSTKIDLINTIFGYSSVEYQLKGRVSTSHFFAKENVEIEDEVRFEVLGEPKETFFPSYIKQTNIASTGRVSQYITLNDEESQIAGYKFYPLQKEIQSNPPEGKSKKVATKFYPLKKGVVFKGKIRYHNLKKEELGALLSGLTFHGNTETHHHNIGMAKPLGYGEISVTIKNINSIHNSEHEVSLDMNNVQTYLNVFEAMMNSNSTEMWSVNKIFNKWSESEQYRELLAIFNIENRKKLGYMQLQKVVKNNKVNEFEKAKKDKEYLRLYSEIFGDEDIKIKPTSITKNKNTSKIKVKYRYDKIANDCKVSYEVFETKAEELGIVLEKNKNDQKKLILEKDIARIKKALKNG